MANYSPTPLPYKTYYGLTSGKLTYLRPPNRELGESGRKHFFSCECGQITRQEPAAVKRGFLKTCGKCGVKQYFGHDANLNQIYMTKSNRPLGGYSAFDITFEDFRRLTQSLCYWCGQWNPTKRVCRNGLITEWHGLDRLDNTIGHTLANCVPCCWDCNNMRGNMTTEEFIKKIKEINDNILGNNR